MRAHWRLFFTIVFMISLPAQAQESVTLLPDSKSDFKAQYYKINTYLQLYRLGCPVPKSAVIQNKAALTDPEVLRRLQQHLGGSYCSLRFQYKVPCPNPKRGGQRTALTTQGLSAAWDKDILLWPVEHVDRVLNQYGLNIYFKPESQQITMEIVGQGFDGTDLNKGDLSPHERITLRIPSERGQYGHLKYDANRQIVSQAEYESSIVVRRKKLLQLGLPESQIKIPHQYTPFPDYQLERADYYANRVFSHFNYQEVINLSATILSDGRLIFWDYQTPENKSKAFVG